MVTDAARKAIVNVVKNDQSFKGQAWQNVIVSLNSPIKSDETIVKTTLPADDVRKLVFPAVVVMASNPTLQAKWAPMLTHLTGVSNIVIDDELTQLVETLISDFEPINPAMNKARFNAVIAPTQVMTTKLTQIGFANLGVEDIYTAMKEENLLAEDGTIA